MTEKGPDDTSAPKGARSSSLVERAARKIVVDTARAQPDGAKLGTAMPSAASADLDSAIPQSEPTGPRETIEGRFGEQQPLHQVVQPPRGRPGGSKVVTIDPARLTSKNLLNPQSKRSRPVEEFRLIKRRVLSRRWSNTGAFGNTIMVTSALPEEGKTTVSINLAMSIAAEEDLRVLLVDADFIKPDALRRLGVTAEKGLIDVIHDPSIDISDVMLRTNIEKLTLIPAGRLHDRCTELLASARMNEIIAELANRYEDRILIFDSPPVLATTESIALASHMGQIVFVVQAGRTRRQLVDSALELLGNSEHVGLLLNRVKPGIGSSEFGYYYAAYHDQNDAAGEG